MSISVSIAIYLPAPQSLGLPLTRGPGTRKGSARPGAAAAGARSASGDTTARGCLSALASQFSEPDSSSEGLQPVLPVSAAEGAKVGERGKLRALRGTRRRRNIHCRRRAYSSFCPAGRSCCPHFALSPYASPPTGAFPGSLWRPVALRHSVMSLSTVTHVKPPFVFNSSGWNFS